MIEPIASHEESADEFGPVQTQTVSIVPGSGVSMAPDELLMPDEAI
jgi:hypothetical protein